MLDQSISNAFQVLFGPELKSHAAGAGLLDPDTVRQAFRKKALLLHPDRQLSQNQPDREARTLAFIAVREAYEEILQYLSEAGNRPHVSGVSQPYQNRSPREYRTTERTNRTAKKTSRTAERTRPAESRRNAKDESRQQTSRQETPRSQNAAETGGSSFGWNGYYRGSIPLFRLRTGEFLYYRGLIPWHDLIRAIVWQRNQRPRFGEIAAEWNLLAPEDLDLLLSSKGLFERIGEAAQRLGILPETCIRSILNFQQQCQRPIGSFFTGNGLLTVGQLGRMLGALEQHNARFE